MTTRFDLHPDDLLDRRRRGALSAVDARRLEQHVAECSECALEIDLVDEFEHDGTPQQDDRARTAAIARAALAAWTGQAVPAPAIRRGWGRAAAGLCVAAAIGAIATTGYWVSTGERERADPGQVAASHAQAVAERASATASVPRERATERPAIEPLPAPVVEPLHDREPEPTRTAAALLAAATTARRTHHYREAGRLYRELQLRHPGSREAGVSRVAYGRLLLDRLGDPGRANTQFELYLSHTPGGSLAEEARAGRALAFQQLGLSHQERDAWHQLIEHHPDSAHGPRARRRLAELR